MAELIKHLPLFESMIQKILEYEGSFDSIGSLYDKVLELEKINEVHKLIYGPFEPRILIMKAILGRQDFDEYYRVKHPRYQEGGYKVSADFLNDLYEILKPVHEKAVRENGSDKY